MSNVKTVKVGVMPGRIQEVAVEVGTPISELLTIAELDATGYEVKQDGTKVDASSAVVTSTTNLVLLTKMVKGNATRTVKVGVMPGRIQELAVDSEQSIASVLELAELSATGYETKVDGARATDLDAPIGSANLILLTKQVKGNAERTVKIGVMPGRIQELAVDSDTSFADVIALAELDATGYEVKADGSKVADLDGAIGSTNLVLLTKMVKGNK